MKAIQLTESGPPEVMQLVDLPDPEPQPDEVLIDVKAVGVNFHDLWLRLGFPGLASLPVVQGIELAGEVVAVGSDVNETLKTGHRVAAMPVFQHGSYAEFASVPADLVFAIPATMSMEEAAALPINYLMAYAALHFTARPRQGERVLIHGAAGGVGLAAVQLASDLEVELFGTASAFKHAVLLENGIDHPIDYRTVDFEEEIKKLTDGEGVDVVLDGIGEDGYMKSLRTLRYGGRLVCYGASFFLTESDALDEQSVERYHEVSFPFGALNAGARSVMSSHLGAPPPMLHAWMDDLLDRYTAGTVRPYVDKVFPLSDAAAAHQYIHERRNIGKVVLVP